MLMSSLIKLITEVSMKMSNLVNIIPIFTIIRAIWDTSSGKLYQDLGLESLQTRLYFRKLLTFTKYSMNSRPLRFCWTWYLVWTRSAIPGIAIIYLREGLIFSSAVCGWNNSIWKLEIQPVSIFFKRNS